MWNLYEQKEVYGSRSEAIRFKSRRKTLDRINARGLTVRDSGVQLNTEDLDGATPPISLAEVSVHSF